MATTQISVPDIDVKLFWRRSRAMLWTLLCAFAAGVFLGVIQPPEFLAGLMGVVYLVALIAFFWPYFAKRWNV